MRSLIGLVVLCVALLCMPAMAQEGSVGGSAGTFSYGATTWVTAPAYPLRSQASGGSAGSYSASAGTAAPAVQPVPRFGIFWRAKTALYGPLYVPVR